MLIRTVTTTTLVTLMNTHLLIKVCLIMIEDMILMNNVTIDLTIHSSGLVHQTDTNIQTTTASVRVMKTEAEAEIEIEAEVEVEAETLVAIGITVITTVTCLTEMSDALTKAFLMLDSIVITQRQIQILTIIIVVQGDNPHNVKCLSVETTNPILQVLIVIGTIVTITLGITTLHHRITVITDNIQAHKMFVRHSTRRSLQQTAQHLCQQQQQKTTAIA